MPLHHHYLRLVLLPCGLACLLLFTASTPVAPSATGGTQFTPPNIPALKAALATLQADPLLAQGWVGFRLIDVGTGQELCGVNASKRFTMASCMKLFSTAHALEVLGPDYRFQTTLAVTGTIIDSTLRGNILIIGSGDPSLASPRYPTGTDLQKVLTTCQQKIAEAGIKKVVGQVIVDDRIYDPNPTPPGWVWGDIGNYYGAPCYGFNITDNGYQLNFKPGAALKSATKVISTDPSPIDLNFAQNNVTTAAAGTGDNAWIDGSPYDEFRFLSGTIPQGKDFTIRGSLPYPPTWFAQYLQGYLLEQGMDISGNPEGQGLSVFPLDTLGYRVLHRFASPPMRQLAQTTNFWSVNLYAEGLMRAAAYQLDTARTYKQAMQSAANYWAKRGIDTKALTLGDGAGLALTSGATPAHLTRLLQLMSKSKVFKDYYESLALAGKEGIVRNVLKATTAEVRMKSGYFSGTYSFAGYLKQGDKLYAFSLVANGFTTSGSTIRLKLEEVLKVMVAQ